MASRLGLPDGSLLLFDVLGGVVHPRLPAALSDLFDTSEFASPKGDAIQLAAVIRVFTGVAVRHVTPFSVLVGGRGLV
jgi:hypothetical protein